jgi:hypothetical protein
MVLLMPFAEACELSQPPTPSARVSVGEEQKKAELSDHERQQDQRGAEDSPLVIKEQYTEKRDREAKEETYTRDRAATEKRVAVLTLWGIIVGAIQAGALIITFVVIAFVAVRQLRAYVLIQMSEIRHLEDGQPVVAVITFKNFGQTPARNCEHIGRITAAEFPFRAEPAVSYEDEMEGASRGLMGPGGLFVARDMFEGNGPIDPSWLREVREQKSAVYVHGMIRYRDVFGQRRYTKYRLFTGGRAGINGDHLAADSGGNEAT